MTTETAQAAAAPVHRHRAPPGSSITSAREARASTGLAGRRLANPGAREQRLVPEIGRHQVERKALAELAVGAPASLPRDLACRGGVVEHGEKEAHGAQVRERLRMRELEPPAGDDAAQAARDPPPDAAQELGRARAAGACRARTDRGARRRSASAAPRCDDRAGERIAPQELRRTGIARHDDRLEARQEGQQDRRHELRPELVVEVLVGVEQGVALEQRAADERPDTIARGGRAVTDHGFAAGVDALAAGPQPPAEIDVLEIGEVRSGRSRRPRERSAGAPACSRRRRRGAPRRSPASSPSPGCGGSRAGRRGRRRSARRSRSRAAPPSQSTSRPAIAATSGARCGGRVGQRREPIGLGAGVVVEQNQGVAFGELREPVVAGGEAEVRRTLDEPHPRVLRAHPVRGAVARAVVEQQQLPGAARIALRGDRLAGRSSRCSRPFQLATRIESMRWRVDIAQPGPWPPAAPRPRSLSTQRCSRQARVPSISRISAVQASDLGVAPAQARGRAPARSRRPPRPGRRGRARGSRRPRGIGSPPPASPPA